ncbi:hypothetical protein HB662_20310 [Roseomonas frigidaquae]|uniref:Uncharacterized protein n=1 Tax=Falsiroseomonas frigidaquae TaxID=487318 RepID=A0ABX1F443_9PROT|nr:hypothetical protein [Falsiroseomonas frigidaquae]NKE47133.1 hypothetical protein [Falsiroseomonas frigidaquae]
MQPAPSANRRKRLLRSVLLVGAVMLIAAASLGAGDVVRAAFEPASQVQPYDPLPRW